MTQLGYGHERDAMKLAMAAARSMNPAAATHAADRVESRNMRPRSDFATGLSYTGWVSRSEADTFGYRALGGR
jgi:hypothetical protein